MPDPLVVQVVHFSASNQCVQDPSLFRAVLNIADGWQYVYPPHLHMTLLELRGFTNLVFATGEKV
jgi:hypothetical protein